MDERPENLVPSEPRRFRERSHEGPLSLPLPRFATQMLNNNNNSNSNNNNSGGSRSTHTNLSKIASPPCASSVPTTSPRTAPQPPASPPPRHPSPSPTSSDSDTASQSPSLEERIRSLDEKYEKWSGSRALSAAGGDALAKLDASASERLRFRHRLLDLDLHEVQPSDIVKSVLAKRSVFDEDSKRLENFNEKYEPREFTGVIGVSSMIGSTGSLPGVGCTSKVCLQYPFPSHPPVQTASSSSLSSLGATTSATSLTTTPTLKCDPRTITPHNCVHPTTPITPGTSIKTVSPELPPVSLPITALGSATAASSSSGSGLTSTSNLLSSIGSVGNLNSVHSMSASTSRAINPLVSCSSVSTAPATGTTTSTIISTTTAIVTMTTVAISTTSTLASNASHNQSSTPPSTSLSNLSSSSSPSSSSSSTEIPRTKLRKDVMNSSRENRESRDSKDSRHTKKETSRKVKKEESEDKTRKEEKEERPNVVERVEYEKDLKETKYERKEREEKERREREEKEEKEKQERREKEERDRTERKEREERERREKDEERRERERLEKERQERERKEREERERERERKEKEEVELWERSLEKERREREEKERQERKEREERERREREDREKKEREQRLEREKQEKERLRKEREDQEKREREEREKIEKERRREEKERLEKERKREREEKERLERERRKEKEERERQEKEKREKEEKEKLEREKRREREDQERREKEKVEREKRKEREEKEKEKRDREDSRRQPMENHDHGTCATSPVQNPAPVAIKRRCSSQDTPVEDDAKRMKISDHRRDSKDRSRQNRRSEDRKHRNDSHRSSRESRDSRESKDSPGQENRDSLQTSCDLTRDLSREGKENNREGSGKEKQRSKKNRSERSEKESRERSPRVSQEPDKDFMSRLEFAKRNDPNFPNDQVIISSHHVKEMQHHHQQSNLHSDMDESALSIHEMQGMRHPSATDTDSDEPKKHSIFDIVDDEPAYISMYDKVKARSTKNMQKLEEEKRQVRLKDKFSQLKQSRARREEKKQSTSWDGDSVSSKALTEDEATSESDSARAKSLSRKGSRSRIHSDTSEEDESFNKRTIIKTERFHESDVDLGFADSEEKHNPLESPKTSVVVNNVRVTIKEEPRTSDDEERMSFSVNHPVANNHERDSRKKSHKKKQKRQKNSMSSEESIKVEPSDSIEHKNIKINTTAGGNFECHTNLSPESINTQTITTKSINTMIIDNAEERMRADKKQRNKKEKRRERNGEEKTKARRKRLNRQEARDSQRMEDIFGPLSDDVDESPNAFFNRLGNMPNENNVYHSDSDEARSPDVDRIRRKSEKKRRHQTQDENSVDLAEAGREIEAKLLGLPNSPKSAVCTESTDHDVFRFTDDNDSVEPSIPTTAPEKIKEKKKKRKKSKEERGRKDSHHHHHHHHHHHDKGGTLPYLGGESSPPRASSPIPSKEILPTLSPSRESMPSPIPKVSPSVTNIATTPSVTSSIESKEIKSEKKKDKFIPGFGIEIDETMHENAVKSISEPEEKDTSNTSRNTREETEIPAEASPPSQAEDKPRVAISQEETEVAVAALMAENFGGPTEDYSYECEEEEAEADSSSGPPPEAPQEDVEEMQQAVESLNVSAAEAETDLKPDTPQSEHDLQIDTDTEEDTNYESFDLTQPPKTPDIPSFYKAPAKNPSDKPLSTLEKAVENRLPISSNISVVKPSSPLGSVISHSWSINEPKTREVAKVAPQVVSQVEPLKPIETERSPAQSLSQATQPRRTSTSTSPTPQYKPSVTACGVPILNEVPRIPAVSPRPAPIGYQSLHQRLPVSAQSQMVPLRQVAPRMQTVTPASSSASLTPLPPLVPSRMPPLVTSQLSPRVSQPLSPNGQWPRNPVMTPHAPSGGKPSPPPPPPPLPPPVRIPVSVPISAHRPDTPIQHIYSTATSQQPVIQHAPGMRALAPNYPRGGLPPLTLNIPPRPYVSSVPPLTPGVQVKSSRDANLGGKSVIETLIPVNPNELQRLDEPKLPAVLPEPTKASTSPKVPSPNQPPTYIPETAKIETSASTSSPIFGKPTTALDTTILSPRPKQHPVDGNLLSPRQKQDLPNLQLLTTHATRASTPSPVIVHGQSHLVHKSVVHPLGPSTLSSPNQPLIKTVVPIVLHTGEKVYDQKLCDQNQISQNILLAKSHVPLVSTVTQTIVSRLVTSTAPSLSKDVKKIKDIIEIQEQKEFKEIMDTKETLEKVDDRRIDESQMEQSQPMLLTPPVQSQCNQIKEVFKEEKVDKVKDEDKEEKELDKIEVEKQIVEKPLKQTLAPKEEIKQEPKEEFENDDVKKEIIKKDYADKEHLTKDHLITEHLPKENLLKEQTKQVIKQELEDDESTEDLLKEPSTDPLALDNAKEDPTDSKEDSDYWSAKEVNIESVIKKVDALCDGEENEVDEEPEHQEINDPHETSKSEGDSWLDSESMEGDSKKSFSNDDQDEGVETCEIETKSRRGRSKAKRGRGGVTTRRGAKTANVHKRGVRSTRGGKHYTEKNKPADVYEFHDDSEEDNAGRPRLILTIKSPGPSATGPNAQPATPVAAVKEVPAEEFVSPTINTRKSRRLAEKDGSRTTVDDIIEDVVRGSANKGLAATRRSTRHNNLPKGLQNQLVPPSEPKKSTRGGKKGSRRISENNDESEEKNKETAPVEKEEIKSERTEEVKVKFEEEKPSPLPVTQKPASLEPMTLIDPVTGMLIPMRESEEGQYIPVSTSGQALQNTTKVTVESRIGPTCVISNSSTLKPTEQTRSLVERRTSGKHEEIKPELKGEASPKVQTHLPANQPAQPTVITKPHSPITQVPTSVVVPTPTVSVSSTIVSTAPSLVSSQPPSTCSSHIKLQSLKAHVLNASKLVNPVQPLQHPIVVTKAAVPSLPSQTIVQNIIKQPVQVVQGLHLQIPSNRVVSPSLSPHGKRVQPVNTKQGQPMSPVLNNAGVPPNPKQHLLQAAKQQAPTIINLPQKLPINVHPGTMAATPMQRLHQGIPQPTALKGINGQLHPLNPKAHLLQAVVPPMMTGAVASPPAQPHLIGPQPVVTGATCSRSAPSKALVIIHLEINFNPLIYTTFIFLKSKLEIFYRYLVQWSLQR